ncbi:unnamed protein product [Protopolystoma xenopodis]|uniref:Uncharacterized protein n=1 Tax=Protopolystoma xenopodis TaxID=117903 RepID=A0A3S5CKX8_9PLAT|nr:unnamed protein product [Protopolystoma xenopodis]
MPSPKASEHLVYVLASNGLYAYTKFARLATQATDLKMINLECMAVADLSGSSGVGNRRRHSNGAPTNFSRFFLGGLQRSLLEVDAGPDRWGTPLRSIDVGEAGCVIFRPCTVGLCAANTKGKASDSRAIKYKD